MKSKQFKTIWRSIFLIYTLFNLLFLFSCGFSFYKVASNNNLLYIFSFEDSEFSVDSENTTTTLSWEIPFQFNNSGILKIKNIHCSLSFNNESIAIALGGTLEDIPANTTSYQNLNLSYVLTDDFTSLSDFTLFVESIDSIAIILSYDILFIPLKFELNTGGILN